MPEDAVHLVIDMPMRVEREPGERAYDAGAAEIAGHLRAGRDVVMLCEGDPFFYGSFIHIFSRLAPEFAVAVVPGVTSIAAAAAVTGRPLASRNDVVKVVPATLTRERLRAELTGTDSAAIIKVGRHFGQLREVLEELKLSAHAVAIVRATHGDQDIRAVTEIEGDTLPYFTTILVRSGP
ncbi:MAG: precorrin-2 C(20)-methyltransferase [Alphaproteobacteria bacterium]|nr:precorrin-2 C(20)-methyltransferase [Alphaproteobacteria bacterium]